VFENRVFGNIFRHKRDEVRGEWRRLHHEEHHNVYYSLNVILGNQMKKNEMSWKCGIYGRQERYMRDFVWDTLRRRALGRRRSRLEDNIKMDLWVAKAWTRLLWLRIGAGAGRF
jgi:hypothetical protein